MARAAASAVTGSSSEKTDQITDLALRQMIQRLSDNGQYAFTATQLAMVLCRHWRRSAWGPLGCGLIALLVPMGMLIMAGQGLIGAILFVVALPLGSREMSVEVDYS